MSKRRAEVEFEAWCLKMPRAELGGLIKEYIAESNHNSWDGFDRHHLTGIRAFLTDVMLYHDNSGPGEGFATKDTSTNPVK